MQLMDTKNSSASACQISLNNVQLMLVENDPDTAYLLSVVFESAGATVIAVQSANQALKMLQYFVVDILVSEIRLPDEDGYSLIRKVRMFEVERGGHIPTIGITASYWDNEQALSAGFNRLISKPTDINELIVLVDSLIRQNTFVTR